MAYVDQNFSPCGQYKRVSASFGNDRIYFDTKRRYASWTFETVEYGECTVTFEGDRYTKLFAGLRKGENSSPETILVHILAMPLA